MGDSIGGVSVRGMDRYEAIEIGSMLQTRCNLLEDLVERLAHPKNGKDYKEAVKEADEALIHKKRRME